MRHWVLERINMLGSDERMEDSKASSCLIMNSAACRPVRNRLVNFGSHN
jgi:hypothetical protein